MHRTARRKLLRWFYADVGRLVEVQGADTHLCFRSARIELRIRLGAPTATLDVSRRLTLAVPSLDAAREQLADARRAFAVLSGLGLTDRRIRTRDPAGNVVELKQEWPEATI